MEKDKTWMKNYSLDQVERAYQNGLLTEEDVDEYILQWNATRGRLTTAKFSGHYIYNK